MKYALKSWEKEQIWYEGNEPDTRKFCNQAIGKINITINYIMTNSKLGIKIIERYNLTVIYSNIIITSLNESGNISLTYVTELLLMDHYKLNWVTQYQQ